MENDLFGCPYKGNCRAYNSPLIYQNDSVMKIDFLSTCDNSSENTLDQGGHCPMYDDFKGINLESSENMNEELKNIERDIRGFSRLP